MKPTLRQGYLLIVFCVLAVSFLYVRFVFLPQQQVKQQQEQDLYRQALMRVSLAAGIMGDEQPSRAIVDDVATLKAANPEFYANARAGDWVLRYQAAVVLYRSQTNEVIKVQTIKP
ncbi:MAG: hypothetical protein U0487_02315 [Patescibacteria group bacterium]